MVHPKAYLARKCPIGNKLGIELSVFLALRDTVAKRVEDIGGRSCDSLQLAAHLWARLSELRGQTMSILGHPDTSEYITTYNFNMIIVEIKVAREIIVRFKPRLLGNVMVLIVVAERERCRNATAVARDGK